MKINKSLEELVATEQDFFEKNPFRQTQVEPVDIVNVLGIDRDRMIYNSRSNPIDDPENNIYTTKNFNHSFLPFVQKIETKKMVMYDGLELFSKRSKLRDTVFKFNNFDSQLDISIYCYPKEAIASENRQSIRVNRNELVVFVELTTASNLVLYFKSGVLFKDYINDYKNTDSNSNFEDKAFTTNLENFYDLFGSTLSHEAVMRYVLTTLNIDVESIDYFNDLFDIERSSVEYEGYQQEVSFDKNVFLPKFKKFINYPIISAKKLDCEVSFFRSVDQLNNKSSIEDKGYSGDFGFDRYNENLSGKGPLAVKYFPIVKNISEDYRAPFLALWAPKSYVSKKIKIAPSFKPVTGATIWFKITQDKVKDDSKNNGEIYFDTGNSKIKINGNQKGFLKKPNNDKSFTISEKGNFRIQCAGVLKDYHFITFRETDQNGKIIGILNVIPNDKIYTTNINVIDVTMSASNILKKKKTSHPLHKNLENYFNTQSFNQAFIYTTINMENVEMIVDKSAYQGISIDDVGKSYIANNPASQQSFHEKTKEVYNSLLVKSFSKGNAKRLNAINSLITKIDSKIDKKDIAKVARKLLKMMIRVFKKQRKERNSIKSMYEDVAILKKIEDYRVIVKKYRNELYEELLKEIAFKKKEGYTAFRDIEISNYKNIIESIIFNGTKTSDLNSEISMNTVNDVYMFLYKDVEIFKNTPSENENGVAGFTTPGDGYIHMLNFAVGNKDLIKRNELIAHELGHAFGLKHTFELNQKDIKKKHEKEKKEFKKSAVSTKGTTTSISSLKRFNAYYKAMEKALNDRLDILESNIPLNNKKIHMINSLFLEQRINEYINTEKTGKNRIDEASTESSGVTESEKIKALKKEEEKKREELEKTINVFQSKTTENFMDYDLKVRKSFWYWQWLEMHYNTEPLKQHIL